MPYATLADMEGRFGASELAQLTDRVNRPPATPDATVVGQALADADALIDASVGKAYQLPLQAVPSVLTKAACDIARYYLHGNRVDEKSPILRAYEQAVTLLDRIATGKAVLDAGGAAPGTPAGGAVMASKPTRNLTRDSLRGM